LLDLQVRRLGVGGGGSEISVLRVIMEEIGSRLGEVLLLL
jgi:hypothetical protein